MADMRPDHLLSPSANGLQGTFNSESRSLARRLESLVSEHGTAHPSCEYCFVNLFCWADIYQYAWFTYQGRLVIFDAKDNLMFMPLGAAMGPESLKALSLIARDAGLAPDFCLVPGGYIEQYPGIERYYEIEKDRDAAEYIYRTDNLAALTGTKLHKKRNLISQFRKKYPDYRVQPLNLQNISLARKFADDLLNIMDSPPSTLTEEFLAMEKAFDHWDTLDIEGLLITVDDRVAAFSVFSPLGDNTYNVHFEKANIAFKGAAQLINRETALHLKGRAEFINREQDLGVEGLRKAKLSYEPHRLWLPYTLRFKAPKAEY